MRFRGVAVALLAGMAATANVWAQRQPPGVEESLANLSNQPATRTSFALDKDTLQTFLGDGGVPPAAIQGISFERFSYHEPAFYSPEAMHGLIASYDAAGWNHLVDANVGPGQSAQPDRAITDIWLHHHGADFDAITVLIRGARQMNLIEVTGMLRPLDLVHLSGHFGIPRVDPNAVMVPAPPGR